MKFGHCLRKQRDKMGYSQEFVAERLGMSQANYHKLESGKSEIRTRYLVKLAVLYKISLDDLLLTVEQKEFLNKHLARG